MTDAKPKRVGRPKLEVRESPVLLDSTTFTKSYSCYIHSAMTWHWKISVSDISGLVSEMKDTGISIAWEKDFNILIKVHQHGVRTLLISSDPRCERRPLRDRSKMKQGWKVTWNTKMISSKYLHMISIVWWFYVDLFPAIPDKNRWFILLQQTCISSSGCQDSISTANQQQWGSKIIGGLEPVQGISHY